MNEYIIYVFFIEIKILSIVKILHCCRLSKHHSKLPYLSKEKNFNLYNIRGLMVKKMWNIYEKNHAQHNIITVYTSICIRISST